jgi:hypothetical protein
LRAVGLSTGLRGKKRVSFDAGRSGEWHAEPDSAISTSSPSCDKILSKVEAALLEYTCYQGD